MNNNKVRKKFSLNDKLILFGMVCMAIGVIGLLGDANVCVSKFGKQFYFDSSANLLYIRNLQGNAAEEPDQWRTIPLVYKNKTYYFAPDGIAYNDPNIGYWNVCVSFDSIVGIYDKKHSVYLSY